MTTTDHRHSPLLHSSTPLPSSKAPYRYLKTNMVFGAACMVGMYYSNLYFAKPNDDTPMSDMYKHYWLMGSPIAFMIIGFVSSFVSFFVNTNLLIAVQDNKKLMLYVLIFYVIIWGVTALFIYLDDPHHSTIVSYSAMLPNMWLGTGILLMSYAWRTNRQRLPETRVDV